MERKTVEILHGLSKIGVYDEAHEVPAFTILVKSYMAEVAFSRSVSAIAMSPLQALCVESCLRLANTSLVPCRHL